MSGRSAAENNSADCRVKGGCRRSLVEEKVATRPCERRPGMKSCTRSRDWGGSRLVKGALTFASFPLLPGTFLVCEPPHIGSVRTARCRNSVVSYRGTCGPPAPAAAANGVKIPLRQIISAFSDSDPDITDPRLSCLLFLFGRILPR